MRHFNYRTLSELQQETVNLGTQHVHLESDPATIQSVLARPVQVGGFKLGNSMAIHPMEGCDGTLDGRPDELTIRRYERFARGGAKLIWFEATAVREDGRANTRQLWITRENISAFASVLETMRRVHREQFGSTDDLLIPLQLTHSGRYSVGRRVIAYHNPFIDAMTGTS